MADQLQKTLGRNLRKRRKELGLSQEKLGEMIGYHRTYVGSIERGERNLTLQTLEQFAAAIGIDPLDLFER